MANFVRVIPNFLWEELEQKGLLDKAFPNSKPPKKEQLISKFPHSLKEPVEKLLDSNPLIDWDSSFQLIYQSIPIAGSNIIEILTKYLTKSKQYSMLDGGLEFQKILGAESHTNKKPIKKRKIDTKVFKQKTKIKNNGREKWKTFEEKYHGRRPKIR